MSNNGGCYSRLSDNNGSVLKFRQLAAGLELHFNFFKRLTNATFWLESFGDLLLRSIRATTLSPKISLIASDTSKYAISLMKVQNYIAWVYKWIFNHFFNSCTSWDSTYGRYINCQRGSITTLYS